MDKVKDLEKDLKQQHLATALVSKKAQALEHEKLDKERALGAGKNGGSSTTASEHEMRERCEELVRECTLKNQIISLLQTENKSARIVQESKARELEAKLAATQGQLAVPLSLCPQKSPIRETYCI